MKIGEKGPVLELNFSCVFFFCHVFLVTFHELKHNHLERIITFLEFSCLLLLAHVNIDRGLCNENYVYVMM